MCVSPIVLVNCSMAGREILRMIHRLLISLSNQNTMFRQTRSRSELSHKVKSDLFMQKCSWRNNRTAMDPKLVSLLHSAGTSSVKAALIVIDSLWQHYVLKGFWELKFKSKKSIDISSHVQFDTSFRSKSSRSTETSYWQ